MPVNLNQLKVAVERLGLHSLSSGDISPLCGAAQCGEGCRDGCKGGQCQSTNQPGE